MSLSISHDVLNVGTPQPNIQEWATTEIRFNGFADLPPMEDVTSPEFINSGLRWKLSLSPRVDPSTKTKIRLHYLDRPTCSIAVRLGIKGGNNFAKGDWDEWHENTNRGVFFLFRRSKVLESLANGAFVIEFQVGLLNSASTRPATFIPENPAGKAIPQMFMDESTADIVFEVGPKKGNNHAKKRARRDEPQAFYAHRLILAKCAPTLSELCGSVKDGRDRIPISDVDREIFRHMLNYVYGGKVSDDDLESHAEEIIDAADRYGVTSLKLEAEASLVCSATFTMENVVERLLYADSKNCALLKEAAVDFIVQNKMKILENVSLQDLPGGTSADILAAVARGERKDGTGEDSGENRFSAMCISDLRRKAHERGLCIDGSREALIAQLKETQCGTQ